MTRRPRRGSSAHRSARRRRVRTWRGCSRASSWGRRPHRGARCHPARTAGRPPRHLRRSDADLGRRRPGIAPDARQAPGIERRADLLAESRGRRLHLDHQLLRAVRPVLGLLVLDDQSRSYEFRHELPIGAGGTRRRSRPPAPRITAVTITGSPGFPENELRRHLACATAIASPSAHGSATGIGWRISIGRRDCSRRASAPAGCQPRLQASIRTSLLPRAPSPSNTGSRAAPRHSSTSGAPRFQARSTIASSNAGPAPCSTVSWSATHARSFSNTSIARGTGHDRYRAVAAGPGNDLKTLTIDVTPGAAVSRRIEITGNSAVPSETLLELASTPDAFAAWLDAPSVERVLEITTAPRDSCGSVSVGLPEMRNGTSVVPITVVGTAVHRLATLP